MVRAIVRSVIHTRDNPEDALQVSMKRLGLERDAAQDAYQMIRQAPVPSENGVELMAQWQAVALNTKLKRKPSEYMDCASSMRSWLSWGTSRRVQKWAAVDRIR